MKIIDADKIEYGYLWKKKDGTAHSPAFAFKKDIMKQPPLPTMQTNAICCYCKNSIDGCTKDCDDFEMFVGKKVIEVSE